MQNKGQNETQVKLITVTYWIKLLLVAQYNDNGIYECITIWCVFELLRTSLLIAYLLRDLWDAISIGYLSVRRYNSVNSFSTAYPVAFQCRCLCHIVSNSLLLLWCALIALVSSALMLGDPAAMKMRIVERAAFVGFSCSGWSRICDVVQADVDWRCSFDTETVGS